MGQLGRSLATAYKLVFLNYTYNRKKFFTKHKFFQQISTKIIK